MAPRLLSDLLGAPVFGRPDLLRFRDGAGWTELSGAEVAQAVRELAGALAAYGAEPGTRVAVIADGGPEALVGALAAHACGAVAVPLDGTVSGSALGALLSNSRARIALVSEPALLDRLLAVRAELDLLDLVLLFRPPEDGRPLAAALVESAREVGADLLAREPGRLQAAVRHVAPGSPASLLLARRGGDEPALVPVSHATALRTAFALARALRLGAADRVHIALPSEEGLAQAAALASLVSGAAISFSGPAGELERDLPESGATVAIAAPALLERFRERLEERLRATLWPTRAAVRAALGAGVRRAEKSLASGTLPTEWTWPQWLLDRLVLGRLRSRALGTASTIVSLGPPLEATTRGFFLGLGAVLLEGFGLAEAGGIVSLNLPDAVRRGTVGRPLPGLAVRSAPGGEMELSVSFPRAPDGTGVPRPQWTPTGWKGGLDDQGFVRIEGRLAARAGGSA